MANPIEREAIAFLQNYASLFSSPDASSSKGIPEIARKVAKHYRPGFTVFTNGQISRFETQSEAAGLIEREMQNNVKTKLGTCLLLVESKASMYSESAATLHVTWTFQPQVGSEFEGKPWTFVNIYGYRAASNDQPAGWEYVVRDNEVNEMIKTTGTSFL